MNTTVSLPTFAGASNTVPPPADIESRDGGYAGTWQPVLVINPKTLAITLELIAQEASRSRAVCRGDTVDLQDGVLRIIIKIFMGEERRQVIGILNMLGLDQARRLFTADLPS